jgi:hypothetical protein
MVGLLDAATQAAVDRIPVVLIAYDHPYPEPLHSKRPLSGTFGVALVLAPQATPRALAELNVSLSAGPGRATKMDDVELEALRSGIPAARCLPLVATFAREEEAAEVMIEYSTSQHLRIRVLPYDRKSRTTDD